VTSLSVFARLGPLDDFIRSHDAFIIQCINRGLPVPGPEGILSLLLQQHEEWKNLNPASAHNSAPAGESNDSTLHVGHGRPLVAYKRALQEDPPFLQALQELEACDLETPEGRESANEISCLAGCVSFQLYHASPASMLHRSPAFTILHQCTADMRAYVGKAQAADPATGEIDALQEHWLPSAASIQLAFAGKLTKFPWFNGDDGALALHNLTVAEPLLPCPDEQIFIVPAVLRLIIPFARATFTAIGWDALSDVGYTIDALFEKQLSHLDFILGLGDMEKATLLAETDAGLRAALADGERSIAGILSAPDLVGHKLSHVLPFGSAYDVMIARHRSVVKPMIAMRRTFPSLMPQSAPRSLPGVTLPGGATGKPLSPTKGKGKAAGGTQVPNYGAPGSLSHLAKWVDDIHVRIGAYTYDVAAICDYYKMDIAQFCVSNLSTKPGEEKLALCQHFGSKHHTSALSAAHAPPTEFNLAYITKHFATKSSSAKGGAKGGRQGAGKGGGRGRGRGEKRTLEVADGS
jgi:hypothetical protein